MSPLNFTNKVILLFCIFFLINRNCFSQDEARKGFTSFNLGPSIPTGNYGSNDINSSEAGYATSGLVLDFSISYKIVPKLGVTALFRSQANNFDAKSYAKNLATYLNNGYPPGTITVGVESSAYSIGGIMFGTYGSFPISGKLSFDPRFLIGFSFATLPAMTTESYNSAKKLTTIIQEEAVTAGFSYLIGTTAKYDISNKVCMLFNVDFYGMKAKWKDVEIISIGHISGSSEKNSFDLSQNFGSVNMSAGLGFRF